MMINNDESVKINHNPNWPYIPDHSCRNLFIGGSESGKKCISNLVKHKQPEFDKIYLYVKNQFESSRYQLLIKRRENVWIKKIKNPKAIIDYSQTINGVYQKLGDYNPIKKTSVNSVWLYDMRCGS